MRETLRVQLRLGLTGLAAVACVGMTSVPCVAQFLPAMSASASAQASFAADTVGPFQTTLPSNGFVTEIASAGGTSPFGSAFTVAQSSGNLALRSRSRWTSSGGPITVFDPKNASGFARASNVSHWVADGPPGTTHFDLDVHLSYSGYFDVGASNLEDSQGFVSFGTGVLADFDVFPNAVGLPATLALFRGRAGLSAGIGLDQNSDFVINSVLSTTSGWSQSDFSVTDGSIQPGGFDAGVHALLMYSQAFPSVVSIPIGTTFAVRSILQTSVGDGFGRIPAGATANFFDTGTFMLTSSTPGVTIVLIPEPSSLVLAMIIAVGVGFRKR